MGPLDKTNTSQAPKGGAPPLPKRQQKVTDVAADSLKQGGRPGSNDFKA